MVYLLTAIVLSPGGSSTIHIHTQTIHRTTKVTTEQHKNNEFGRVRTVPRLCEFYPRICLTIEEKARKNLSQGKKNCQDKKTLSQGTVYKLPKYSIHITEVQYTYYQSTVYILPKYSIHITKVQYTYYKV